MTRQLLVGLVVAGALGVGGESIVIRSRRAPRPQGDMTRAIAEVRPAVVMIEPERRFRDEPPFRGLPFDPGRGGRPEWPPDEDRPLVLPYRQSLGAGIILDRDGLVLTTLAATGGADTVEVTLEEGRRFGAELVADDGYTDLAPYRIEGGRRRLPVAELGDSDRLSAGEPVVAIGSPLGLRNAASAGIISRLDASAEGHRPGGPIAADFPVHRGGAGGPWNQSGGMRGPGSRSGSVSGAGSSASCSSARASSMAFLTLSSSCRAASLVGSN